jgi:hypothetical protein
MKTAITLALLLASAPAFADKTIVDNKQTTTIDCAADADVTIAGNENTVTLTGACKSVTVSGNKNTVTAASSEHGYVTGNGNTVTVDAMDYLAVPGNNNVVTYKATITKGGKLKLNNPGKGNKVTKSK